MTLNPAIDTTNATSPERPSPPARQAPSPWIDILGVPVSTINMADALRTIESWIASRTHQFVCVTGAHGVIECRSDPTLRDIHHQAGMVTPDGMPLVWFARLMGARQTTRVYGPDLMRALTALSAQKGYRQFYYGGTEGIAEKLGSKLCCQYPGLAVAGSICPPFRRLTEEEDARIIAEVNAAKPDIVWVGLSTPKQEYWMSEHLGRIDAPVMIGVGAAFDFLAGAKKQAPLWMQRNGLEWLFRLMTEPRRLWRRYSYIVPIFIILSAHQLFRNLLGLGSSHRDESLTS
jgi:N-acetylglucosaminyldiphosphoundecaprenol N-acetyl-beta-D-mannosaminyltransferase